MKKKKTLYLLCGIPGSGKSYWAKNSMKYTPYGCYISRDEIRFSMLKDGEDYFSHEDEVYDEFVSRIQNAIDDDIYNIIYADATHLNEKSRNKLLNKLKNLEDVAITPINFMTKLEKCIERNNMREGLARVPISSIKRMYICFSPATYNEKYKYDGIISLDENNEIIKEYRCGKCSKKMICSKSTIYPCKEYHRDDKKKITCVEISIAYNYEEPEHWSYCDTIEDAINTLIEIEAAEEEERDDING